MQRRLGQHRTYGQGSLTTADYVDWILVAYVHGFPLSELGVINAFAFETAWRRFPAPRNRPVEDTIKIGRYLIANAELRDPPLYLRMETVV